MRSRILMTLLGAAIGSAALYALRKPHQASPGGASAARPPRDADDQTAAPMPDDGLHMPGTHSDMNPAPQDLDGADGNARH